MARWCFCCREQRQVCSQSTLSIKLRSRKLKETAQYTWVHMDSQPVQHLLRGKSLDVTAPDKMLFTHHPSQAIAAKTLLLQSISTRYPYLFNCSLSWGKRQVTKPPGWHSAEKSKPTTSTTALLQRKPHHLLLLTGDAKQQQSMTSKTPASSSGQQLVDYMKNEHEFQPSK